MIRAHCLSGPSRGIAAVNTHRNCRIWVRAAASLGVSGAALLMAGGAAAQGLPPLSPAEIGTLPPEYRTAPVLADRTETSIGADGVETITRTRFIAAPAAAMAPAQTPQPVAAYPGAQQTMMPMQGVPMSYAPMGYTMQPVVFDRSQWIEECRRRTAGRSRNDAGTIIGALLGAIGGGVAGNLLAGAGDKLFGTAVGAVGGGVSGGLIGSLFNRRGRARYDCEAALDSYLSQPAPVQRIASREIAYPAPAYAMPVMMQPTYAYAQPMQNVVVPVQYEQQQQVVVRETVREEVAPGATRMIPAPRPTKLIKAGR